jgi:hypothetical protein
MKNLQLNTVNTFKLSSGEELVAKVISIDGDMIQLEEPLSIAPTPKGMQLLPSIFTGDEDSLVTLNLGLVVMTCPTAVGVKDKYLEATTGIQIPDKKLILG